MQLGHSALLGGLFCAIGNPLNDGEWTYTWENGRQLARMQNIDTDASFVYNENGLRVQKTVNGIVTKYTLHGKNIVHMTCGSDSLHFFYDASNKPAVVVFNGTPYSYAKNLQGDIVAILNSNGMAVVNYVYDAWGRPISKTGTLASTLGTVQPFRYRGYVYDEETGLYYLRSRCYNAWLLRFITVDKRINILDKFGISNLYSYGSRTPVNTADSAGTDAIWIIDYALPSHVSLLIEDQNGVWHYFYWGASDLNVGGTVFGVASSAFAGSSSSGVSSGSGAGSVGSTASTASSSGGSGLVSNATNTWSPPIYCDLGDVKFSEDSDVIGWLRLNNDKLNNYAGEYDDFHYFHGDYSASHALVSGESNRWPADPYDLMTNNCVQTSIDLLMASADSNPDLEHLKGLRGWVVPGLITIELWKRLGK